MPVQHRIPKGYRLTKIPVRKTPTFHASGKSVATKADRAQMSHLYRRGFLEKKHYQAYLKSTGQSRAKGATSGGGSGSRSEAARKAWVTRRGH